MSLITRQGKGSKLTIEELDGNLTYLEGLVSLYKKTVSSNIDWSEASMQEIEINEDTNFTFTGATTGQTLSLILDAKKTALITWPESIQWTTDINQLDLNYTISYTDVGTGFNSDVYSIAIQADGKIIVGGYFSEYNGVAANGIIRLNSNGSRDESFNMDTGFNSFVFSIEVQSDGKILVGGGFTSYNGVSANGIIRLNSDGSVDESFVIGTGFNGSVQSIAIQADGKILVGGAFTEYNGVLANRVIRLNSDGSRDESFVIGTGFNGYYVFSIEIQDDGKILVGGSFTSYNGVSSNYIIRLNSDGSVDESFVIGTGFDSDVYSIEIQDDGKILVGGYFTSYNGVSSNYIIRLNSDGSRDTLFDTDFDINLTNILYVIKTKLNNIYLGFLFENPSGCSIIMYSLNYEQAYEICNFYYNGTYYIGESTI